MDITIHILLGEEAKAPNGGMTYPRSQSRVLNPGLSIQRPFPAIIHFFLLANKNQGKCFKDFPVPLGTCC